MIGVERSTLTGAAGEHLVMSRLLTRGYIAALAPRDAPNFDIVVTSADGSQLCAIQVKTRWEKGRDGGWHMRQKHENLINPRIFHCFVDLGNGASNDATVYIVPSHVVAKCLKESYQSWLNRPGLGGRQRKATELRRFLPDYKVLMGDETPYPTGWLSEYRENWGQLSAIHESGVEERL